VGEGLDESWSVGETGTSGAGVSDPGVAPDCGISGVSDGTGVSDGSFSMGIESPHVGGYAASFVRSSRRATADSKASRRFSTVLLWSAMADRISFCEESIFWPRAR
jgi:hypothetical protein